eukprot:1455248-Amphidinium_carterae.1
MARTQRRRQRRTKRRARANRNVGVSTYTKNGNADRTTSVMLFLCHKLRPHTQASLARGLWTVEGVCTVPLGASCCSRLVHLA